jgi:hypothetical protein
MTNPPRPPNTNPDDHAPGISKTLEENAARSREVQNVEREKLEERERSTKSATEVDHGRL